MDNTNQGLTYGAFITLCVGIIGGLAKFFHGRIKKSECFGVKIEMEQINNQVQNLEQIVSNLQNENNGLKNELQQKEVLEV